MKNVLNNMPSLEDKLIEAFNKEFLPIVKANNSDDILHQELANMLIKKSYRDWLLNAFRDVREDERASLGRDYKQITGMDYGQCQECGIGQERT